MNLVQGGTPAEVDLPGTSPTSGYPQGFGIQNGYLGYNDPARSPGFLPPALTLANGALAYSKIWKNSEKQDTSVTLEAAINSYLSGHRSITKGDERLVTKSK